MSLEIGQIKTTQPSELAGLSLANNAITNVADPTNPQDAATKQYVDDQTPSSDYQNLTSTALYDDLTLPPQVNARGTVQDWTCSGPIRNGALVVRDYTSAPPNLRVKECDAVPTAIGTGAILGVALNATAAAGDKVSIMSRPTGFCTAIVFASEPLILTASTSGTTVAPGRYAFTDSGGANGEYKNDEDYFIIFDAGVGQTWTVEMLTWQTEQTATNMYDRLGIQWYDGAQWNNVSVPWMYASTVTAAPWGQTKATPDTNGWIFPPDKNDATSRGWSGAPLVLPYQIIRFYFYSDFSQTRVGWEFQISSTVVPPPTNVIGSTLFVDPNEPHRLGNLGTVPVAVFAGAQTGDSAVVSLF